MKSNKRLTLSQIANSNYRKPELSGLKFFGFKDRDTACFEDQSGNELRISRKDLEAIEPAALNCPLDKLLSKVYPVSAYVKYIDPLDRSVHFDQTELNLSAKDVSLMLDGMNGRLQPNYEYNM